MSSDGFEQIEIPDLAELELLSDPHMDQNNPLPATNSEAKNPTEATASSTADKNIKDTPIPRDAGERKPTAEYALHILFTRFVRYTEKKLAKIDSANGSQIESIFGEGVEPEFDMILESLGHVARRLPKPIIDSIMFWLQTKRDKPNGKGDACVYVSCRALMEVVTQAPHDDLGEPLWMLLEEKIFDQLLQGDGIHGSINGTGKGISDANWRYLARLLGEMSSFRLASVDDKFVAQLEKKIYSKSDEARAMLLLRAIRYLKIKLYPEESLEESSIFLESLSKFYTNTPFTSILRAKYASAICHILEPLAEAITVEVNQPLWSSTMQTLFNASQEQPQEKQTLSGIANRSASSAGQSANNALSMPAFSLSVMSLCLSPQPVFSENWFKLLESNVNKNKTKPLKNVSLFPAAARLTWVYMFRCGESLNLTTKKIEALRRMFYAHPARKYWQAVEADREAYKASVSLIRSCFQGYQQYTLDEVLFRLLVGTDANSAQSTGTAFDSVLPERACIAVDAFVDLMHDLKSGNRPPFPSNSSTPQVAVYDGLSGAKESSLATSELPHRPVVPPALMANIDLFGTCIGEISNWLEQGGIITESASRQNSVSNLMVSFTSGSNNTTSNQPSAADVERNALGIRTMEQYLLLLFLRSWPSWWKAEQHLKFLDVLSRCVGHPIPSIRDAAIDSFSRIAQTADLKQILTPFSKAMMYADAKSTETNDSPEMISSPSSASRNGSDSGSGPGHGHSFSFGTGNTLSLNLGLGLHNNSSSNDFDTNGVHLSSSSANLFNNNFNEFAHVNNHPQLRVLCHLQLYVELIEEWISRLQNGDAAIKGSSVEAQILGLWAAVEEIEGNGLYFLCSQDRDIRSQGLRMLWLTTAMDQAILNYHEAQVSQTKKENRPSRVINLLQNTPIASIASSANKRFELNEPELKRLNRFGSSRASLARLAESRVGVDIGIWRKLFPSVINMCFESHPVPMALCRNLVVERIGQMYETVNDMASRASTHQFDVVASDVIEQWKNYLIVACATLTSTEEQKIYVPSASAQSSTSSTGQGHSKKPSQKLTLHHKRITSIKSVFRIVAPMLKSENNTIREAMITGLSCTNVNTFKTLLECLQPVLSSDIQKLQQIQASQVKSGPAITDPLLHSVTCITQIFTYTTNLLETKEIRQDMWIRTEIVSVLHQLRELLGPMKSMDISQLRVSFCELLADTYNTLKPSLMFYGRNPAREWLLFWTIVEHWSPFGTNSPAVLEGRSIMKRRAQNDVVLTQLAVMNLNMDKATSRAIAALFVDSQDFINDLGPALHWIYSLLATNAHPFAQDIGRIALQNLLLSHASRPELLMDVIGRCYHNTSERSRGVAKVYFVALVDILASHPNLIKEKVEKPQQFFTLALFKIGDPDCETRFRAVKLIEIVENGLYGSSVLSGEYQFKLRSTSPSVYKREIFVLSGKLANERSHESFYLFSQMTRAFQAVNDSDRRDILSVLLPWIQNIEFKPNDEAGLQMVIVNLLEITTVFSGRMQHEVEALWIALCTSQTGINSNALRILDFLLNFCLQYRSPGTVAVSRNVLIYLLASPASSAITEKLLSYLEPKFTLSQSGKPSSELVCPESKAEYPYVAALSDIVNLANEKAEKGKSVMIPYFSYDQLAVVFLVDTISASTPIIAKLPALIHVCVVLGDYFVGLVQEKTRELLLNLAGMLNPAPEAMEKLSESVTNLRWNYRDDSGTIPDQLGELVTVVLRHLSECEILDPRDWAQTAILWATTSPVRHIACRSLQIYRCLPLELDVKMIGDLLARLSGTVSELGTDKQALGIQGFSTQILMTINAIIDKLDPKDLISFPSLFWASIASLSSANEREYIEGLSSVDKLLSKWSGEFAKRAVSSFPPKWECDLADFPGALKLILRGLRSQNSCELSHSVANKLISLSECATENDILLFFGSRSPLPQLLAATVPWMLTAMDQPHLISRLTEPTQALQRMVAPYSNGLLRILESFEKRLLWSKPDFLRQFFLAFVSAFPNETVNTMILVMSMVNNGAKNIRRGALDILHILVPEVKLQDIDSTKWCSADLIAPLLRLLTTPDVEEALKVLDLYGYVRPDRKDKDVLRMTLGSRQLFQEYENTETLFGIPDEAGWSVPMPAQAEMVTRSNMHSVFYICANNEVNFDDAPPPFDPAVDESNLQPFQLDEFNNSITTDVYSGPNQTLGNHAGGFESMDKIVTDLDEYDSFFTRAAAPTQSSGDIHGHSPAASKYTHPRISRQEMISDRLASTSAPSSAGSEQGLPHRARSVSETESIPQLYDKKVSLILNQSLARTPSQVSFRSNFGDTFGRATTTSTGLSGEGANNLTSVAPTIANTGMGRSHSRTSSFAYTQPNHSTHLRQSSGQGRSVRGITNYEPYTGSQRISGKRQMSFDSSNTVSDTHDFESVHSGYAPVNRATSKFSGPQYSEHDPNVSLGGSVGDQSNLSYDSRVGSPSQIATGDPWYPSSYGHSEEYDFFPSSVEPRKSHNSAHENILSVIKSASPTPSLHKGASNVEPSSSPASPSAKSSTKPHSESSFRLESLLRGRRKAKPGKDKDSNSPKNNKSLTKTPPKSPTRETFQFPPR